MKRIVLLALPLVLSLSLIAASAVLIPASASGQGQPCLIPEPPLTGLAPPPNEPPGCGFRVISTYATALPPTSATLPPAARGLMADPAAVVLDAVLNAERTGEARHLQLDFEDAAVVAVAQGTPLRLPGGGRNTAPEGPVPAAGDYLIASAVTAEGDGFRLDVRIEATTSRELVAAASAAFVKPFDAFAAAQQAGQQLVLLSDRIMQFERQKRDQDPGVAIRPRVRDFKLIPASDAIKEGQSVNVAIELADCDGAVLKNRTVTLRATGGSVSPSTVTTDDRGRATVRFTAGAGNEGILTAEYKFRRPSGYQDVVDSAVQLKILRNEVWKVAVEVFETRTGGARGLDVHESGRLTVQEFMRRSNVSSESVDLRPLCATCVSGNGRRIVRSLRDFGSGYQLDRSSIGGSVRQGGGAFTYLKIGGSETVMIAWPWQLDAELTTHNRYCTNLQGCRDTNRTVRRPMGSVLMPSITFSVVNGKYTGPPGLSFTESGCGYSLAFQAASESNNYTTTTQVRATIQRVR